MPKAQDTPTTAAKSLTRREAGSLAIIGAIAAVTGSAINAAATTGPDPIFAAIETHRSAWADLSAFLEIKGRYDESVRATTGPLPRKGDAGYAEAELDRREIECGNAAARAANALCETRPTTIAGAITAMRYVVEFGDATGMSLYSEDEADIFISRLADGLETLAVQS